ncbi:GNAT family N-acetyltransferase [Paraglaciecola aquimarina]|uniref:tRNA(Met) cytidine acetyltransferase TmcA n=1 Tax=Paraglaciecola algarum TaxID=3050085 RepID=A0ABS9D1V6_9ALTE|nr:GNAT family N-acetyltransferase [Paraglaciecola sp. G1-23]MCF2946891.1 GNAT family N-acetyltransferase [Paraglaciecola sp. G1-23]
MHSQLQNWLQKRASINSHRQLLVISGDQTWARTNTLAILQSLNSEDILWIGQSTNDYPQIPIKEYKSKLGHEYSNVVLDCFDGFRANAAIALSGTVKSGGLMIMLCPNLTHWPNYPDPEITNRLSFGIDPTNLTSFFLQYLGNAFIEDENLCLLTKDKFIHCIKNVSDEQIQKHFVQQQKAVVAIQKVTLGHRNRPLIITADRGRGKSSALGIAAAELMQQGTRQIIISAPHIDTVSQVFKHIKRLLPTCIKIKNQLKYQDSCIKFVPIDILIIDEPPADVIFIDEAAAIPVKNLTEITQRFSRIVFSTTIHGYEGSGRGFDLRFKKILTQIKPAYSELLLSEPIRWYQDDPLEQFWFNALLYKIQDNELKLSNSLIQHADINCKRISKQQLISSTETLAHIFSLLLNAHYQTSPDDLQRILDCPEVECFVIEQNGEILGTAQIIIEGGESLELLGADISSCKRRVKGHLVAQNISSSYNIPSFAASKQWRITRIAINPRFQSEGLGSQLIEFIKQQAKKQHVDFVSTAFGLNMPLLNFWQKSGFSSLKLSSKIEVSSGEHNCIYALPLNHNANELQKAIQNQFCEDLLFQMDKNLQALDPLVLIQLLGSISTQKDMQTVDKNINPSNLEIIHQFCFGNRPLSSCMRNIKDLLINNLKKVQSLPEQTQSFLTELILQNRDYQYLAKQSNLSGKKQIEQKLKTDLKLLLEYF